MDVENETGSMKKRIFDASIIYLLLSIVLFHLVILLFMHPGNQLTEPVMLVLVLYGIVCIILSIISVIDYAKQGDK
jgi:hypothetical protein